MLTVLRAHREPMQVPAYEPSPTLSGLLRLPDWYADAVCAQVDPEIFFPEKGGSTVAAKRVCMECPVRIQCGEDALARDERFGIYGGMSERERRAEAKRRGPAVAA